MGKRKLRILYLVLVIAFLVGLTCFILRKPAVSYRGKSLQQYLDQYATNYPRSLQDASVWQAIRAMGPRAIPELRRALRRKDSTLEKTLAYLRPKLPARLARLLPTAKPPLYWRGFTGAAAEGLALFGPQARVALPDLIRCLGDDSTANAASYAIQQIGPQPENLPALLALLNSTNIFAPSQAIQLIARIGIASPTVLTALTNAAGKGDSWNRNYAIRALGELGPKAAGVKSFLAANLADPSAVIRVASAEALMKISDGTNPPVAWFVQALTDELDHPSARSPAANVFNEHEMNVQTLSIRLGQIGGRAQAATGSLRRVEEEPFIQLRAAAVEALWKINGETNRLLPVLREAMQYFDGSVKYDAARFLTEFAVAQGVNLPDLDIMLASKEVPIRFYAARALWKLHHSVDTLLPSLLAGLHESVTFYVSPMSRQLAAETLGEIGPEARAAVPDLLQALNDPEPKVKIAAAKALKAIDPEAAAKAGVK